MTFSVPSRRIGEAWSSIRGLLQQAYSTQGIKEVLGKATLPTFRFDYAGTYKGPLLDEVDKWVKAMDGDARDRFVSACIEEIVASERIKVANLSKQGIQPSDETLRNLEQVLARVGYGLSGTVVFPLTLQLDIETASLPVEASEAIAEALRRYRDGRFAGAITSICGAVDQITERVFATKSLGDHKAAAYQERISRSFATFEAAYCNPILNSGFPESEVRLIWENHKKSVSQAGYVIAAFRRQYSDAHGQQGAPAEFVQKSLDCAVFILRSFCGVLCSEKAPPS